MTVQTFDNFWVIEDALTDAQCDTLISWWNNQGVEVATDGSKEIHDSNWWNPNLQLKQTISCNIRKTEVIGIPLTTFDFLDTAYNNIFAAVHGSSITLEGPTYFNKYETGGIHMNHTDITSNYTDRKYVCTIQLSADSDYTGGNLQIHKYVNDQISSYEYMTAPRTRGCAIVYNNKAVHGVTEITSGTRYSLNDCAG